MTLTRSSVVVAAASAFVVSAGGLALITNHEGRALDTYLDPVGIPTNCVGHTRTARIGQTKTAHECEVLLREDTGIAGRAVARCTRVPVTQEQYDVLVSFVFNVGEGNYCGSTLARKLNAGDCWGAAREFSRWVYAKGRKLRGLVTRRAEERHLFETGCHAG